MTDVRYTFQVRDASGQIVNDLDDYKTIEAHKPLNNTGTWQVVLDPTSISAPFLLHGGGIVIQRVLDGVVETVFSGSGVYQIERTSRSLTISGLSDEAYLEEPARPTPSLATAPYPNDYDVRTGVPSTVMRNLVDANVGFSAPAGPKVPNLFITQSDPLLGATLASRANLQPLLALLRELAATPEAGGLAFSVVQHETNAGNIDYRIYAPQDRTLTGVTFSVEQNSAVDFNDVIQYSNVNYWVVLGGDGFGSQRTIVEGGNAAAIAAAGRRIVGVFDARGTVSPGELEQKLAELLAGATSARKTSVTVFDSPDLIWGKDWNVGDTVKVAVAGEERTGVISEAVIADTGKGVTITPTIADPGATNDNTLAQHVQSLQDRMSNVERNWNVPDASIIEAMMANASIGTRELIDHSVTAVKLHANDTPNNNEVPAYDTATGFLKWLSFTELAATGPLNNLTVTHNTTLGTASADALTVNAASTFNAGATLKANVTVENSALSVLAAFNVTAGAQTVTLGDATAPGLYVDVANGRTIVGTVTAPSGGNDKFWVVGGRTYLAANSETVTLGLRYLSSDGSVFLGASHSATPDLIVSNNAGSQLMRALDGGGIIVGPATAMTSGEQLHVPGKVLVTTGGMDVTGANVFRSATSFTAGGVDIHGGLEVVTGGLTVDATGVDVTGPSIFRSAVSFTAGGVDIHGGLDIVTGGITVDATGIDVTGSSVFQSGLTVNNGLAVGSGNVTFPNTNLGFFGSSGGVRQNITGSRGGNVALANLLIGLSNLGLITNSTT